LSRFLAAIHFLTIIPIPWRRNAQETHLEGSVVYFPVVGLVIGLILAGLNWLFRLVLPPGIANALLLVVLVILNGALHLDGLADTCDGLAGHKTVEDRWRIMRDSRVGGFGVIGVVLLLLLKYVSLNSITETLMLVTLVLMPVISRWALVYVIFAYPYARPSGLGKAFKQGTGWQGFTVATVISVAAAALLAQLAGLVTIFIVWVITAALAAYLQRKFAGLTGDNYGAINEVAEVGVLISINLLMHLGFA
jgi:adenosylcobinamide-GDP ribazoletransferase